MTSHPQAGKPPQVAPPSSITWASLPDPTDPETPNGRTTTITLKRKKALHVVQDHALVGRERRAWRKWLGREVFNRLRVGDAVGRLPEAVARCFERMGATLGAAVTDCLRQPLAILFQEQRQTNGKNWRGRCWLLLLPNGAQMIIGVQGHARHCRTCFFGKPVVENFEWQHRTARRRLLQRYAIAHGRQSFSPATSDHMVRVNDHKYGSQYSVSDISLVTVRTWGLVSDDV